MTTTRWKPPPPDLPPTTIIADRWDQRYWQEAHDQIPRLAELTAEMAAVSEAGPDAMADLDYLLFKADPQLATEVRPDRAVNKLVASQLRESDGVNDLRRHTAGSQVQAALGCISMQPKLRTLYEEVLSEVQDKAEAAQQAADEASACAEGFPSGAPGQPGGPTEGDTEALEAALDAAQAAQEALDAALEAAEAKVGQVCRAVAETAAEEADNRAESMAGWGAGPGELARLDATEYLQLAERLADTELAEVARLFGAMHNLAIGARKEKVHGAPTEIVDIELGQDLSRLLPSEYLGLVMEELEDDFYKRFAGKQLLQYRLDSVEHVAKGSIVLLEDSSGSMYGQKHSWAKAFGLSLGDIARSDRRAFHAVEFASANEQRVHAFPDATAWTTEARLTYAESFLDGGTSFTGALDAGLAIIEAEYAATGRVQGDIVMLTDGIASVGAAWLEQFKARQESLGFKCYVLVVGGRTDSTPVEISRFADYVGNVTSFTDGTDAHDIFKAVSP